MSTIQSLRKGRVSRLYEISTRPIGSALRTSRRGLTLSDELQSEARHGHEEAGVGMIGFQLVTNAGQVHS